MKKIFSTLFIVLVSSMIFSVSTFADLKLIQPVGDNYYSTSFVAEFIPIQSCDYSLNTIEVFGIKQKSYGGTRRLKNVISINHSFKGNTYYDIDRQREFIWANKESVILHIPKKGLLVMHYTISLPNGELINISDKINWFEKTHHRKKIKFPRKIPRECRQNSYSKYLNRDSVFQRGKSFLKDKWESPSSKILREKTKESFQKGRDLLREFSQKNFRDGLQ